MEKSAGIIVIGNEILSGLARDRNAAFMSKQLRRHGIKLRRIATVPDDIDEIAHVAKMYSERFDSVFTSGGLGPTPDDVTIAAISKAFNVRMVVDAYLKSLLQERFQGWLSEEKLKMAQIPAGALLLKDETLRFPLIKFRNVYMYPGVPKFLQKKFIFTMKLIKEQPAFSTKIYVDDRESEIAPLLSALVKYHNDVQIGSYPIEKNKQYQLLLTMESYSRHSLDSAMISFNNVHSPQKK